MTWLDGGRWDQAKASALVGLLSTQYPSRREAQFVLEELGVDIGQMPADPGTVKLMWVGLTLYLHDSRQLRTLIDHLAARRPALAAQLAGLAADPAGAADVNPADVYEVRVLFGHRPLIDRTELRQKVRDFLTYQTPLLMIRGQDKSGKSYSLELLQHVCERDPRMQLIPLDFTPVANGNTALDLIAKLCRLLAIEEVRDNGDPTTPQRKALALVDQFVGRYNRSITDQKRRLLVIDGLNRRDLEDDVHEAVAALAVEVIKQRLSRTQLVLTGYGGDMDPDLDYGVETETVTLITEFHVRSFFEQLALPTPLSRERIDELVSSAMTGPGDVPSVGRRVRDLTRPLLVAP